MKSSPRCLLVHPSLIQLTLFCRQQFVDFNLIEWKTREQDNNADAAQDDASHIKL